MKLILIILISICLNADQLYEVKLYEKVFTLLFKKENIKVYTGKGNKYIFNNSKILNMVDDCKDADIIFVKIDYICTDKPIFVKDYIGFKEVNNVIGSFYYRKGRPQLKLNKKNIEKFKLYIEKQLMDYVE